LKAAQETEAVFLFWADELEGEREIMDQGPYKRSPAISRVRSHMEWELAVNQWLRQDGFDSLLAHNKLA